MTTAPAETHLKVHVVAQKSSRIVGHAIPRTQILHQLGNVDRCLINVGALCSDGMLLTLHAIVVRDPKIVLVVRLVFDAKLFCTAVHTEMHVKGWCGVLLEAVEIFGAVHGGVEDTKFGHGKCVEEGLFLHLQGLQPTDKSGGWIVFHSAERSKSCQDYWHLL